MPMVDTKPDLQLTGPELRALRHSAGLSLRDLATKWPSKPIARQSVAALEREASVSAARGRSYLAAFEAAAIEKDVG